MDDSTGQASQETLEQEWREKSSILQRNLLGIDRKLNRPGLPDGKLKGLNFHKGKVVIALQKHHEGYPSTGLI